jgi:hypothetical protein
MADPLYELLVPYFDAAQPAPAAEDPTTTAYLNRLSTLPLSSLSTSEPQSLTQTSHSLLLSLQKLSLRSHKHVIAASDHLATLRTSLPSIARQTADLRDSIPTLDESALRFSETYHKSAENAVLDRRRQALLLSRNVDRLADLLDLPTLLSSAIASGTSGGGSTGSSATINYAAALDLNAHIKRLHALYPESKLISSVSAQAEAAMLEMATNLIASLRTQGVKLAAAMRTISWLRRVAPELDGKGPHPGAGKEGSLGALFLLCRLANLLVMLEALEPLRELADQESERHRAKSGSKDTNVGWSGGQQTERYLKRYIEIFREQSFAIISMYRSIFPPSTEDETKAVDTESDPLQPLPSALSTFPLYLIDMLSETLKTYLPNVQDKSSRDSLLTQVLYCAGSLGRLGGDFSMILAFLDDDTDEWVEVIKKHRVLAGRLESMVGAKE